MNQSLSEKLNQEIAYKNKLLSLIERFPDLKENKNRWNHVRLSSKLVNSSTNDAEIKHNCGCCDDSPLEVWPYAEIEGLRVFSDPASFTVGQKSGLGDIPYPGWDERMRKSNIPQIVIDRVNAYFDAHLPESEDETTDN
jgi:hypothetical protein